MPKASVYCCCVNAHGLLLFPEKGTTNYALIFLNEPSDCPSVVIFPITTLLMPTTLRKNKPYIVKISDFVFIYSMNFSFFVLSVFCMLSTGRYSVTQTSLNTLVVREYVRTRIGAYYAMFVTL